MTADYKVCVFLIVESWTVVLLAIIPHLFIFIINMARQSYFFILFISKIKTVSLSIRLSLSVTNDGNFKAYIVKMLLERHTTRVIQYI